MLLKDYQEDKSFLKTLSSQEKRDKLEKEAEEVISSSQSSTSKAIEKDKFTSTSDRKNIIKDIRLIEMSVVEALEIEFGIKAARNVGIGDTEIQFDAIFINSAITPILVEIKLFRAPLTGLALTERLLYQAVIADNYFKGNCRIIFSLVYKFEEQELDGFKQYWQGKAKHCPADIEIRFFNYNDLRKDT